MFNFDNWVPAQWGKVEKVHATFENMDKDIAYLPVFYIKGRTISASTPFWLKSNATMRSLSASKKKGQNRDFVVSVKGSELWGMKNGKKDKPCRDTHRSITEFFSMKMEISYSYNNILT